MTCRSDLLRHIVYLCGTVAIALGACAIAPLAACGAPVRVLRVRTDHPTIARLIAQATERSATFRREIDAIDATDGLVYVHEAPCGHGVLACLAMTVELAGPYRLLRVKLDLRRSERHTMAAIGHELQHAIEVLDDPHVTNTLRLVAFYQHLGPTSNNRFETATAVGTGIDVFRELRAQRLPH